MSAHEMVISLPIAGPYITKYENKDLAMDAKKRAYKRAAFSGFTIRVRKARV